MGRSFIVHTGHPSWHQMRAGHISSGITEFTSLKDAEEYVARCKALRPNEPAFIVKEVK